MAVKIGHAAIDERGRITGGADGDQTGQEVCMREWYPNSFTHIIRPLDKNIANKMAIAMEQACLNNKIGYNQARRTTLYYQAAAKGWDLSKITTPCATDCSALIAVCVNAAGISVSKDMYTGNEINALQNTGKFMVSADVKYIINSDYLERGDILWKKGHTAMVLTNGAKVAQGGGASSATPATTSQIPNTSYCGKGIGEAAAKAIVNVRSGASTQYDIVGSVPINAKVEVLSIEANGWYKVVWPGVASGYGYVSNESGRYFNYTSYVPVFSPYMIRVTTALNIRSGPSTAYGIVGVIQDQNAYTIVEEKNGWGLLKTYSANKNGWISLKYTKKI